MVSVTCACLFDAKDDAILLVRVRDNERWYFAGGKIEPGETPEQALRRELDEELGIKLSANDLRYRNTVEGPAYGQPGLVQLICFESEAEIKPAPSAEVSEVAWLGANRFEDFAPAVQVLYRSWQAGVF